MAPCWKPVVCAPLWHTGFVIQQHVCEHRHVFSTVCAKSTFWVEVIPFSFVKTLPKCRNLHFCFIKLFTLSFNYTNSYLMLNLPALHKTSAWHYSSQTLHTCHFCLGQLALISRCYSFFCVCVSWKQDKMLFRHDLLMQPFSRNALELGNVTLSDDERELWRDT